MEKPLHFHKYERMKWDNGKPFYKCMEPGCNHYLPHLALAIGRESLCWGNCARLVVITKEDVHQGVKHPMCPFCKTERKERREQLSTI